MSKQTLNEVIGEPDVSNGILSKIEIEKVRKFCEDEVLFESIKKYILNVVYGQGVIKAGKKHEAHRNWALNLSAGAINPQGMPRSDEELGQQLRALTYATQLIESGFKELLEMKKVEEITKEENNPAE